MQTNLKKSDSPKTSALFLGSKRLGFRLFEALYLHDSSVNWVVVHPDDSKDGRSQITMFQEFCSNNEIDFVIGSSGTLVSQVISEHHPHIAIVCGWYSILSENILPLVPAGFWGVHHSLLPRYRGNAPLVWAIINGDEVIGSTIFKFNDGMDAGPVLSQVTLKVSQEDSIATIEVALEKLVLQEFLSFWPKLIIEDFELILQNDMDASYVAKRVDIDSKINWNLSAKEINNHIRAQQSPYPIAHSYWDGKRIEILKSFPLDAKYFGAPGQVFNKNRDGITVTCGGNSGILITEVQIDGRRITSKEFPFQLKTRFLNTRD